MDAFDVSQGDSLALKEDPDTSEDPALVTWFWLTLPMFSLTYLMA